MIREQFELNGNSYRLQDRYCNKKNCKCHDGNPHGPYWYVHTVHGTKYIGKTLPASVEMHLAAIEQQKPLADDLVIQLNDEIADVRSRLDVLLRQRSVIRSAQAGRYISDDGRDYLISVGLGPMAGESLVFGPADQAKQD